MDSRENFLDVSPTSPSSHTDDFNELFQQLEPRHVGLDLIQTIKDELISLFEIQGLVVKLNKSEVPSPIVEFVLDFEPHLEQVVQVVRNKQESISLLERRVEVMHEHQVHESQHQVVELEETNKAKNRLVNLEDDILSWTQQINWLQLKIEVVEKEKDEIDSSELASVSKNLVEVANTGIECTRTARILEAEVSKLRVAELMVDKKLERTRSRFEELRSKLNPLK